MNTDNTFMIETLTHAVAELTAANEQCSFGSLRTEIQLVVLNLTKTINGILTTTTTTTAQAAPEFTVCPVGKELVAPGYPCTCKPSASDPAPFDPYHAAVEAHTEATIRRMEQDPIIED